jgi:GMP synthase-like glutamine amidotransferase
MIYIIQHNNPASAGTSIDWCRNKNYEYQIIHLASGQKLPNEISSNDYVIICGGAMNVDEEHLHPWMVAEKEFIKTCINKSIKILGLCLGAQLIAEALGARVSQHPHWEVGWWPVQIHAVPHTPFEKSQALQAFQWHGYSFDTPKGAVTIAGNEICTHQGFIYNNFAVGLQFHPEASQYWIKECADSKDFPTGLFVQNKTQIYEQLSQQINLQNWYFNFLNNFFKK